MSKYIVYSKPNCTFCDQAKALLAAKDLQFDVINLDVGQPKTSDQVYISREALLNLIPTARTMPQIMRQDDAGIMLVGGFAELRNLLSS